ncbi:MAG: PD-(D/E)XK nuclease domain-containing protein, partial [Elusimicrobiota bacterium]|nr:PD-(D/E)XK nuclease domain-containing protein [Elusimicrobiota bacterium]
ATSGFLLDLVEKDYNYRELVFDEINVSENLLTCANLKKLLPISILFQTGYLTISAIQTEPNKLAQTYTLVWPNEEVKCSFSQEILESMTGSDNLILLIEKFKKPIIKSFETLNAQDFQEYFPLIYACIPYNALEARESNYQAIFILAMRLMGFDISGEDRTSWGSADAVIRQQKQTIIVEIKYAKKSENVNKKVDAALKQIKDKKYWQKHISPNKKIILLGLVFANKGKVVKGKFEEMK